MNENETKGLSWPVALLVTAMICLMAFLMARMLSAEKERVLYRTTLLPCTSDRKSVV